MKRVLIAAAALAVAASAPAGAVTKRYFRLDVSATQHVKWTHDTLVQGCSESITRLRASGSGDVTARDKDAPWAVVQRTSDPRKVTLLVHGEGPGFAAAGSYRRYLKQDAFFTKPPKDPKQCGKPLDGTPDCGTRGLPKGSLLYLSYIAPGAWTYPKPKPKGGVVTLSGPYVPDWVGMPPFQFCGGASGDDTLSGSWYDTSMRPMFAALPPSKFFGKARRFSVTFDDVRTVQTARPGGAVLEDDHPVTTTIHWRVTFTRVGAMLQAPEL
jgi:hypothetical protein